MLPCNDDSTECDKLCKPHYFPKRRCYSNFHLPPKDTTVGANADHRHARCLAPPKLSSFPEDSVV